MNYMEREIWNLIIESYGSIPKFAKAIDVPDQTVYSALYNGLRGASLATVMPMAAALRLDPIQLAENKVVRAHCEDREYIDVPLYGSIAAGVPIEAITSNQAYPIHTTLHAKYPHAFLLRVSGESMNRTLPNGSLALIDPCDSVETSGHIYAVNVGAADATIKRVMLLDNGVALEPDSSDPTFRPYVFDFEKEHETELRIIGRVVWFCPPLNRSR